MDATSKLVSVLVPCFNAARHLPATLDSVESLRWPELEIVLVDDGSTDNSLNLLRAYQTQSRHRVQVLTQANQGAAVARNQAFAASHGAFIQYLDADDLLDADKIDLQAEDLLDSGAALNAGCWGRFVDDPDATRFVQSPEPSPLPAAEYLRRHLAEALMLQPSVFLARRELIAASGGFDPRLSLNDDGEFFARVIARAGGIRFVSEARCRYRSGDPGTLAGQRSAQALASALLAMQLTQATAAALDGSALMREARAKAMARVAAYLAPHDATLAERAWHEARALDPKAHWDEGGRSYRWLKPWLGWQRARRVEHLLAQWRAMRRRHS
ncbi:hypothetical protein C7S18_23065 [Ahniella affigens]|uniref:Glycosyltransferase 2-like domain-containing protein n=1 Tax=Ahniella affigens TaxID=2021234 RepID=A0A2P1PYH6_9GAMM|nr:glycosyltransferase family A protein [Ahniella affigens]AVP99880.1 hypothetical protein C7S18_23065 [Ahniella affigens]